MRLALVHARAMTLELARYPAYIVPTLVLPTVFFLFFVSPGPARRGDGEDGDVRRLRGRSASRSSSSGSGSPPTAPPPGRPTCGRCRPARRSGSWPASALGGDLRIGCRRTAGRHRAWRPPTRRSPPRVGLCSRSALLAGTVPFAFLGIALGYWAPAKGALPIANLLYLVLAYAGGLWIRPSGLPGAVAAVSRFLPTRALSDALVAVAIGAGVDWRAWSVLALFSGLFAVLAVAGYRRDEGRRFS